MGIISGILKNHYHTHQAAQTKWISLSLSLSLSAHLSLLFISPGSSSKLYTLSTQTLLYDDYQTKTSKFTKYFLICGSASFKETKRNDNHYLNKMCTLKSWIYILCPHRAGVHEFSVYYQVFVHLHQLEPFDIVLLPQQWFLNINSAILARFTESSLYSR